MSRFQALKDDVVRYLQGREAFGGIRIQTEYLPDQREYPLKQPVVAVGLDGVELSPGGFGGYWGQRQGEDLFGSGAQITLRFDLYASATEGAGRLHDLYEALCTALMSADRDFGFLKLWSGEIAWDREASANRLTVRAALRAAVLRQEDETCFLTFRLLRNLQKE